MVTKSAEFNKAVEQSRKLKTTPSNDEMLELYALFKQGNQDPVFEKADQPGMFDLKGKAKYNAWKKVAEEKMSPEIAQKNYVELVEKLKGVYGVEA